MSFTLTWEDRGVYKKFTGFASFQEYARSQEMVLGSPLTDDLRYVINDLLEVEGYSVTQDEAEYAAAITRGASRSNPHLRIAFVTNQDHHAHQVCLDAVVLPREDLSDPRGRQSLGLVKRLGSGGVLDAPSSRWQPVPGLKPWRPTQYPLEPSLRGRIMSESLIVVCPHCHAANRVPSERLDAGGTCGKCKGALFAGAPVEVDEAAFDKHVDRSELPIVVDFWAPWCGPCRQMTPAFAQAARALEPRYRLIKVNTEQEQGLAARFGIRSIPTIALFKNGREIARQAGAMDAGTLTRWIQSNT